MAWYDEAVFYHIYPLGLAGAPMENSYGPVEHRLNTLLPWISHIKEIGCNALYIGPLFESVGHGYETTDYKKLDSRLGDNEDLKNFVAECHKEGIRVIFDGVFNHTGRDFFAFKDIQKNREGSPYRDWYCNVNFGGNTEYNDGFSYENWGGYNLLVKLNQRNPAVKDHICDAIRFWVSEFDVDGIRLDAADVLDFDFMQALRHLANEVKPDFWLMGEVIHGDYSRWVNEGTLHSVTNYQLHKALYSGHNDHNYFEIAHTVKRLYEMGGSRPDGLKLYNFVDNHDVERIYTKLNNKAHFAPVHIVMYTLPGIPSVYYGSEFAIDGRKEKWSDASLRPALNLSDFKDAVKTNPATELISALGHARQKSKALAYGDYRELLLTNRQYAFSRNFEGESAVVTVNNDDSDFTMTVAVENSGTYVGILSGEKVSANGSITVNVKANYGELWLPEEVVSKSSDLAPVKLSASTAPQFSPAVNASAETTAEAKNPEAVMPESEKVDTPSQEAPKPQAPMQADSSSDNMTEKEREAFEKGKIAGLQEAILATMEKNGPLTDQMRRDVANNVYHDSLINWIKSFR
ncbi:MAG: alpha-amylase family glycosyl hydrolase [Roseburia sp.]|nr:alpha-amylase family glycosyl hydrolase [Roseburia sp.]